ncbi:MAG TPA: ATP-binding protein [Candidatus Saccharimonas sp.]|nr:ATP-binding protein [Candidatus Saccharimonas sp.]
MSLLKKLAVLIAALALPALLMYVVAVVGLGRYLTSAHLAATQRRTATQGLDAIDRILAERRAQAAALAGFPLLRSVVTAKATTPTAAQAAEWQSLVVSTGPWASLELVNATGQTVLAGDKTGAKAAAAASSEAVRSQAVAAALTGQLAVSKAVRNPVTGQPVVYVAVPVWSGSDAAATVRGALVAGLDWAPAQAELDSLASGTGTLRLYDPHGVVMATSPADTMAVWQTAKGDSLERALTGHTVTAAVGGTGRPELATYQPETGTSGWQAQGWVLSVQTLAAPSWVTLDGPLLFVGIGLIAVWMAMCAIAMWALYRVLVRPVREVTAVAHSIALGDVSRRVPEAAGSGELSEFSRAFNAMTEKVQELRRSMEEKVREKTVELNHQIAEVEAEKVRDDAILASIGEGMIALDASGKIIKVNEIARQLLGWTPDQDQIGRNIAEATQLYDDSGSLIPPGQRPGVATLRNGQKIEETCTVHHANGTKTKLTTITSPVKLQQTTVGAIMTIRDVTKEREVDRMKTEFISLASHQLRTPLSAIKWFGEMLLNGDAGKLKPEQREYATNISDSTERMIQLVNSLLNISRIESGRIIVDPKPTDLHELVGGIINELKAKTEAKDLSVVVSIHKELPKINLDPRLVSQVYLNLLTNAIKYTRKGGNVTLFISRKDDQILSQVTDDGYGIPKADQGKVFQKFFRADNIVKIETDGTGLGLYLVRAIIESSGGKIWFESDEKKGTTFWFTLPVSGMKAKSGEVTLDV